MGKEEAKLFSLANNMSTEKLLSYKCKGSYAGTWLGKMGPHYNIGI